MIHVLCYDSRMPAPELDYDIQLSEDRLFLWVTISGEITATNALDFERDAAEACREYGVNRVLLDVRNAANVASTLENAEFERDPRRNGVGFPPECVRMMLTSETDRSHDMIVTFLRNKGHQVHLSRDEYGAVEFLRRAVTTSGGSAADVHVTNEP